jgi:hypothetical protein
MVVGVGVAAVSLKGTVVEVVVSSAFPWRLHRGMVLRSFQHRLNPRCSPPYRPQWQQNYGRLWYGDRVR